MKIFATHYNTSSSVNIVCSDKVRLLQKDYFKKSQDIGTDTYQTICLNVPQFYKEFWVVLDYFLYLLSGLYT